MNSSTGCLFGSIHPKEPDDFSPKNRIPRRRIATGCRPSSGRAAARGGTTLPHHPLIARSEEEYIDIAVALASDLPKLAHLRAGLRQAMETGPLMDEVGFVRKVETAYREMFGKWVRG